MGNMRVHVDNCYLKLPQDFSPNVDSIGSKLDKVFPMWNNIKDIYVVRNPNNRKTTLAEVLRPALEQTNRPQNYYLAVFPRNR